MTFQPQHTPGRNQSLRRKDKGTMHALRRLMAIASVLAVALAGSLMTPWPALARHVVPPPVPAALQVPAGNIPYLVGHATGTQNYTCLAGGIWSAAVPRAILVGDNGHQIATHFAGPTWQAKDGSTVVGKALAAATVSPDAIPWLLLAAVSTSTGPEGGDRLSETTYIQRLNTSGGKAPAGACASGATASVPYTADYYFYRASAHAHLVSANSQSGQIFTASASQRVTRDAVLAATAPTCQNIQLLIRPLKGNGAAGHAGEEYSVHNMSNGACTLRGFPGLLLLDSRFVTLPTSLTRSSTLLGHHPVQTVQLGSGGTAYFALSWATIPTSGQGCPTAPYLMITPPNDRLPVVTFSTVGSGIHPCGGRITATPVVPSLLF